MGRGTENIIILGAGPVGLVSAWEFLKRGKRVTIYEKMDQVGGMCRTWEWEGFLLDTGPHIFHTPDTELAKYWEDQFGELFLKNDFWCKNVKGDKFQDYWDYPLSWESISKYPNEIKKKILKETENLSPEKTARAKSFSEYILSLVGPTLFEMFFQKYPKKSWGISGDEMTAEWAPRRIEIRQDNLPFYHGQYSAVGKFGTGAVYERLKKKIIDLGGKIFFGETITKINTNKNIIK